MHYLGPWLVAFWVGSVGEHLVAKISKAANDLVGPSHGVITFRRRREGIPLKTESSSTLSMSAVASGSSMVTQRLLNTVKETSFRCVASLVWQPSDVLADVRFGCFR